MNPARSPMTTGALPSFSRNATTSVTTSGSVITVRTTSTSLSTGAGLKKCVPTTLPGRLVWAAISVTDSAEVLEASTVAGGQIRSSAPRISALSGRSSGTASTTRSQSASAASEVPQLIRPSSAACSAAPSLPLATARVVDRSRWARARVTPAASASTPMTVSPVRANTSAMPDPMVPRPTTPTVWNSRAMANLPRRRAETALPAGNFRRSCHGRRAAPGELHHRIDPVIDDAATRSGVCRATVAAPLPHPAVRPLPPSTVDSAAAGRPRAEHRAALIGHCGWWGPRPRLTRRSGAPPGR